MQKYEYGNKDADIILLQAVDDHDLEVIDNEVHLIKELTGKDFRLIAFKVGSWNNDLSPWHAPAVFGDEDFGAGADDTLEEILSVCGGEVNTNKKIYIGGYSLAGLFALWAAHQTDVFEGVAAASPSVWFPGFTEYMRGHECKAGTVYLSLGDKEEKARNPVMATVADRIREAHEILMNAGVRTTLEWNQGNHFKDPDLRTAKAFSWVMD
ncbi:MAG: esterase [Clostridiales bacterium]|nr:esterase [Clostridiales bacterium]